MDTANSPLYKRAHYFLQVGTKHVVSTELQILKCKGSSDWFGDVQFSNVIEKLKGDLMARIDRKHNDFDMQIVQDDSLLIAYKFRRNDARDCVLIHRNHLSLIGVTMPRDHYGDGNYASFELFPEKLMVTVSSNEKPDDQLKSTDVSSTPGSLPSDYFTNSGAITNSEKKTKEALKKISGNFNNQTAVAKDVPVDNEPSHHSSSCEKENIEPEKKAISFKEKISAFERKDRDKVGMSTKTAIDVETEIECDLDTLNRDDGSLVSSISNSENMDCTTPTRGTIRGSGVNNLIELIEATVPPEIPKPSSKCTSIKQKSNKRMVRDKKKQDESKIRKDKHTFSDDEDFLPTDLNLRKVGLLNTRKSKRKRISACDNATTECKDRSIVSKSFDRKNAASGAIQGETVKTSIDGEGKLGAENFWEDSKGSGKTKSTEPLMQTRETEKHAAILKELPTFVADETIDLDDYGNVSLENVESITDLSVEQIRDLVRSMEDNLRGIFEGKTKCERHDLFKQGGKQKGTLNMKVAFGLFTEEQEEYVTNTLISIFCSKNSKYFDYTMKVLLPETMAMIYAKVAGISHQEADRLIMERC